MKIIWFTYLYFISFYGWSQSFPEKGQYPSTAYPVCGADTIRQTAVPLGSTSSFAIPACGDRFGDVNPFYYAFTCYTSGTLGFVITPNDSTDNYDWLLFDVTGLNPSEIYNIDTLMITGNRSGTPGQTGAKFGAVSVPDCVTGPLYNVSTFTPLINLIAGRQYLLLVSHPTNIQSGYSLVFTGGTAVLNDPTPPVFISAVVGCDKKTITVGISKYVRCNSLAPDGSDFSIPASPVALTGAVGLNCNPQFDFDYLEVSLATPLTPGNYSLQIKTGTDNNTLLDDCGVPMNTNENINFTVSGLQPTLDSLTPPVCSPNILLLNFSSPILCSSIAADGSDFTVTGNSAVAVSNATGGVCSSGTTNQIQLSLAAPIDTIGNYQVTVVTGSDGNTLTNECNESVTAGSALPFYIQGTVSADFDYSIGYGCILDTIKMNYPSANGANQWEWYVNSTPVSSLLNPEIIETVFGLKNVEHIVSSGLCNDTVTKTINLDNFLKAQFQAPKEVCPKTVISLSDSSIGNIVSYFWDFGDGSNSSMEKPLDHLFPDTWAGKTYSVLLVVKNNLGCLDTAAMEITKLQSCAIAVPNAFTPNGDGKNDYLYPLNAFSVINLEFKVFNRVGQLVFETRDWTKKWDGTINGLPQDTGAYVWTLSYTDVSGRKLSFSGVSVLIR